MSPTSPRAATTTACVGGSVGCLGCGAGLYWGRCVVGGGRAGVRRGVVVVGWGWAGCCEGVCAYDRAMESPHGIGVDEAGVEVDLLRATLEAVAHRLEAPKPHRRAGPGHPTAPPPTSCTSARRARATGAGVVCGAERTPVLPPVSASRAYRARFAGRSRVMLLHLSTLGDRDALPLHGILEPRDIDAVLIEHTPVVPGRIRRERAIEAARRDCSRASSSVLRCWLRRSSAKYSPDDRRTVRLLTVKDHASDPCRQLTRRAPRLVHVVVDRRRRPYSSWAYPTEPAIMPRPRLTVRSPCTR